MAYRIVALTTTSSDFQGHSSIFLFFSKSDFSYSYAAVDTISTDKVRRAVPLR